MQHKDGPKFRPSTYHTIIIKCVGGPIYRKGLTLGHMWQFDWAVKRGVAW